MHRIRYVWIGLCLALSVFYVRKLQTQFAWDDLCLVLGWGLLGFVALVNAKLVWPYEVSAEYQPKVSQTLSVSLLVLSYVLLMVGGISNLFF
nr:hypothetical protein [uncultured Deefgea sp.]